MKHIFVAAVVLAAAAAAQVSTPRIGIAADRAGVIRPVSGVAGNLIAGDAIARGVISAAASDTTVMMKTASELVVNGVRRRVAGGPALFAFERDGSPALVWLSDAHALLAPCRRGFCSIPLPVLSGEVVAVGAGPRIAVVRNGVLEVLDISDGAIARVTRLPGASAPLLLADGSMVYGAPGALVFRDRSGHEKRTAFAHAASSMTQMSSSWAMVEATQEGRRFAVRLSDGAAFQIPEVQ